MKTEDPTAGLPRRELEESRLLTAYGLTWLEITVLRVAGVRKGGEVRYKPHRTRYLVTVNTPGVVTLVTERQGEDGLPVQYEVTAFACSCEDFQFKGSTRTCKHFEAVREHRLLAKEVAGGQAGGYDSGHGEAGEVQRGVAP